MTRILIVEDESKLAAVLQDYLQAAGYEVQCLADGTEVMETLTRWHPALLLLDLMLPGRDGLEICRELRRFSNLPVIMLTARVAEIDRLLGLELGADDYICKPFSPREVVARVRAVLRRSSLGTPETLGLQIDTQRHQAYFAGQDLDLTPVEFRLLEALARHPGMVLSREQLMDRLYADGRIVSDRTVDSHVKNLRRKLAALEVDEEIIRSVYGIGYCFEGARRAERKPKTDSAPHHPLHK